MSKEHPDLFDDAPWDETPDPAELETPFRTSQDAEGDASDPSPEKPRRSGKPTTDPKRFWWSFLIAGLAGAGLATLGGLRLHAHRDFTEWLTGPVLLVGGVYVLLVALRGLILYLVNRRRQRLGES